MNYLSRKICAKRRPMRFLDKRFRISKPNPSAPTIHYGLSVTPDNILHCARNHILPPLLWQTPRDGPTEEGLRVCIAVSAVQHHLARAMHVRLFFEVPLGTDYLGVLAIYTNRTRRTLSRPKPEKAILNFLRRELDMDENHTATMWYWDSEHGLRYAWPYPAIRFLSDPEHSYECDYAKFNL